jgi:hypothetical protein
VASLLAFAWLLAGGALDRIYAAVDAAVFLGLWAAAALAARSRAAGEERPAPAPVLAAGPAWTGTERLAALLVAAALLAALAAFARASAFTPHGEWDAWAIWNLRARFLVRAGEGWRAAFSPELARSQIAYPLLVPLSVARLWAYAGESTFAPALVAGVFTFATPLALAWGVARAAGIVPAATAVLALLATSQLTELGASQYADVPVAALFVVALGLLLHAGEGPFRARRLGAAGLLLGLAGWTKNEGLVMAAAAVLACLAAGAVARGRRALRDLGPLAAGAALPAAAWLAFHLLLVPSLAPSLAASGPPLAARVLDPERWRLIGAALWRLRPGGERQVLLLAPALALVLGARPRALARSAPLLAVGLLLCCYVAVYVLTPLDLAWHLDTSAERVLFQPWPALLLALFAAVGSAEGGRGVKPSPG